jgi:hypothetical protein
MRPDSSFIFDVSKLTEGSHQIIVSYSNSAATTSSITPFQTYKTISPSVDLSSNITEITDLTTQVTITAMNISGGGNNPLYTFAKDRNITNVIQAESSLNYVTQDPSTFVVGDNWVYIKMKTSSACYLRQFDYDSIKLTRTVVTGIFDPDQPGRKIHIYPNPFDNQISIKGLSELKTYRVRLYNNLGRLIKEVSIKGKSSSEIRFEMMSPGNYIFNLFDLKKQKSLGSINILKR